MEMIVDGGFLREVPVGGWGLRKYEQ